MGAVGEESVEGSSGSVQPSQPDPAPYTDEEIAMLRRFPDGVFDEPGAVVVYSNNRRWLATLDAARKERDEARKAYRETAAALLRHEVDLNLARAEVEQLKHGERAADAEITRLRAANASFRCLLEKASEVVAAYAPGFDVLQDDIDSALGGA